MKFQLLFCLVMSGHAQDRLLLMWRVRPVLSVAESVAKTSRNRTLCTPFLRLIFDDKWKGHERCLAGLDVHPLCQMKRVFQLSRSNCVGVYEKRNGLKFKTKNPSPGFCGRIVAEKPPQQNQEVFWPQSYSFIRRNSWLIWMEVKYFDSWSAGPRLILWQNERTWGLFQPLQNQPQIQPRFFSWSSRFFFRWVNFSAAEKRATAEKPPVCLRDVFQPQFGSRNPAFLFTQENTVIQQYSNNDVNVSGMSLLLQFLLCYYVLDKLDLPILIHLLLQESIRSSEYDDSTFPFGPFCVWQCGAVTIHCTFGRRKHSSASRLNESLQALSSRSFQPSSKISRKKGVRSVRLRLINLQRLERAWVDCILVARNKIASSLGIEHRNQRRYLPLTSCKI
jgi:hypothetical protein